MAESAASVNEILNRLLVMSGEATNYPIMLNFRLSKRWHLNFSAACFFLDRSICLWKGKI